MKFRKKPVVIEAFRFGIDEIPEWFLDELAKGYVSVDKEVTTCAMDTLEGVMTAREGDYIIQGVKGEVYPCKPDIFSKTYEHIE